MRVVPYEDRYDFEALCNLFEDHKTPAPTRCTVPEIGYIAFDEVQGYIVAAAFLRKVEGSYGQLDSLISNPVATSEQRHRGIDLVVTQVINKAKDLGITGLIALTKDVGTLMRSEKHGFVALPVTTIALDLTSSS